MGQKLFEDKITALTESGGTITLASGARLTIGGQQYTNSSALNVAATVAAENTRYQVYAVLSGGVVILVVSTNENSVGPAGYNAWKLVGSYYSGESSSFGSFVNISGDPSSGWIASTPTVNNLGAGGTTTLKGQWRRFKDIMEFHVFMQKDGTPGSGSTSVSWTIPTNNAIDYANMIRGVGTEKAGTAYTFGVEAASQISTDTAHVSQSEAANSILVTDEGANVFRRGPDFRANSEIILHTTFPIVGWNSTPIKDL